MAKPIGRRERRRGKGKGEGKPPGKGSRPAASTPAQERAALDALPRWLAPVVFLGVTLLLFRDFVFSGRMLYGVDTLSLGYMARAFLAESLRAGTFPLWNPVILGGTPFLESLAGGDSLYPPSLLLLLLMETYRALGWKLVLHVFLAGCFMYGWLRALGVSRGAALVGGLSFLLAPYMVSLSFPGHDGKLFVTALTPLLFWCCEWSRTRRDLLPLSAVGAVVALVILTTHFQMAYFLFGAVGAYMAFLAIQDGRREGEWKGPLKRFGLFVGFSVVGAGAAGVQLIPAVDYVQEHSRRTVTTVQADPQEAVAYSSSWSLHPEEIVSLVVPEFIGSDVGEAGWATDTYWGRNPFKLNHEYLGLVALLLATLAFLGRSGSRIRWFLAGLGGISLLFTLGSHTPVWRIFYEVLPGISLFRAPSMVIFLTGFSVATLAGLGVDRGVALAASGEGRRILRVLGALTGVLVVGWLLAAAGALIPAWLTVFSPDVSGARAAALARAEPYITIGFFLASVLAGLTLLGWWAMSRRWIPGTAVVALLCLLVFADQLRVNEPFVQTLEFAAFAEPDGNQRFLMDRRATESPFRVFSMYQGGQDVAPGMHGLELAAGHHPNDLRRYRELIGMEGSGIPEHLAYMEMNVLRLLNVRYVLWPDFQFGPLEGPSPLNQLHFADGEVYGSVYPSPGLPRARVVGEALVVPEDETMDVILGDHALDYDPSFQTLLTEPPPTELGGPGVRGQATWIQRTPNRLVLDVQASGPALVVLSENWFPAWKASVDGASAPVLRADHTLRAVPVPAGTHRVELWYASTQLTASLVLSILCILGLGGAAGFALLADRRGARSGPDGPTPARADPLPNDPVPTKPVPTKPAKG